MSESKDGGTIHISDTFAASTNESCSRICERFADNLTTFYQDSGNNLFTQTKFSMTYSDEEIKSSLFALNNRLSRSYVGRQFRFSLADGGITLSLEQRKDSNIQTLAPFEVELAFQLEFLNQIFFTTFLLPAERNSLILTYKMLLNKRFSLLRDRERQIFGKHDGQNLQSRLPHEQGDIRYPQPIEDFLDMLSEIELSHKQVTSSTLAQNNGQKNDAPHDSFADVAGQIERYIQGGNTTSYSPTTLGGSEIMVKVKKGLDIDLYNASSSIKQLAPLLLYLRYRAAENQLLIIRCSDK